MKELRGKVEGGNQRIALVVSRFNEPITKSLLKSALDTLHAYEVPDENLTIAWVPGAFEVPLIAKTLARSGRYDAVICLGAVIRGETPHFDYVAQEAAAGIAKTAFECEIPVIFGILTTDTVTQALERIDKGQYAAEAALEMIDLMSSCGHRNETYQQNCAQYH